MNKLNLIKSVAAAVAVVGMNAAFAADPVNAGAKGAQLGTVTIGLDATVNHYCKTVAAGNISIAAFNPDTAQTAESKISVYCTTGTVATIYLDGGSNYENGTQRRMKAGSDYLNYAIRVAAGGADWSPTNNTQTVTGAGLDTKLEKTAFIDVPVQAAAKPGVYADSVTVTVSY